MKSHKQPMDKPMDFIVFESDAQSQALNIASRKMLEAATLEKFQEQQREQAQQAKNNRVAAETGKRPLEIFIQN